MEDKLFCRKCHLRIWRTSDLREFTDTYLDDEHFNCVRSLGWDKEISGRDGQEKPNPYREMNPHVHERKAPTPISQ